MNSKQAQKVVLSQSEKVREFQERWDKLNAEVQDLQAKHAEAAKALAAGDESQENVLEKLDKELRRPVAKRDGCGELIREAQADLANAEDTLQRIKRAEESALNNYQAEKEAEDAEAATEALPDLEQRITETYLALCEAIADHRLALGQIGKLNEPDAGIAARVTERMHSQGIRRFSGRGMSDALDPWAALKIESEFLETRPAHEQRPGYPISFADYLKWLQGERVGERRLAWRREHGLED